MLQEQVTSSNDLRTKKERESAPQRPSVLPVNLANIPVELKDLPQFVAWKFVRRNEKWTKIPVNPRNGNNADTTDPSTWGTIIEAMQRYTTHPQMVAGIGFVFSENDPFAGVDLDDSIDPATNELKPWAKVIVDELNSYTEVSPSGTGVKIFVRGSIPPKGRKKGNIETYDNDRFFALTGTPLPGSPATVNDRQTQLMALHTRVFQKPIRKPNHQATSSNLAPTLDDAALIEKAKRARNGAKFAELWNGGLGGFPSPSEGDQALCSMLAFWCGKDQGRIDALFRQSGRMREKWDERRGDETYGQRTIGKAIENGGESYSGRHARLTPSANGNGNHQSGEQQPPSNENIVHLTDLGNAKRIVIAHGVQLRHCHPWGKWIVWKQSVWANDDTSEVTRFAKATLLELFRRSAEEVRDIQQQLEEQFGE